MTTMQTTIPFKARKRLTRTLKDNDANLNTFNIKGVKINKKRRTRASDQENRPDEECSPKKISRTQLESRDLDLPEIDDRPQTLPGREAEIEELKCFLASHLETETSGSLYVSGQPGTGKTACLSHVMQLPQFKAGYKTVYVNCTTVKSAGHIYSRICSELKLPITSSTEKACLAAIEKYLSKKHHMTLLVLDEIDQLDSKKQSVLYTIFEWAGLSQRLVLVGVANALDLTERVLPRLRAAHLRPRLMHFQPYTREQISEAIRRTLAAGDQQLFSPVALQMLAAKVAAVSGDMRRALDLARRVVELARRTGDVAALQRAAPTVELQQVLSVLNAVYGAPQQLSAEVRDTFPLQQKLLVCSLLLALTRGRDVVVGKLYDVYRRVASKRNIAAVSNSEFMSLCDMVESRGVIALKGRREPRALRVALRWDRRELEEALGDTALLADILGDKAALVR